MKDIRIDLRYGPGFFFPFGLKDNVARVVAHALFSNRVAHTQALDRIAWGVVDSCEHGLVIDIVATEGVVKASSQIRDRLKRAKIKLARYKVVREAGVELTDIRITLIEAKLAV